MPAALTGVLRRPWRFAGLVLFGLFLDQVSKHLVFESLPRGQSRALIQNVLHLTCEQNTGVAFSVFRDHPGLALAGAALVSAGFAWWYARVRNVAPAPLLWAQALVLAGALGNIVDRARFGAVRDFIDFRPEIPLIGHWAVFNVADVMICAGAGLIVVAEFIRWRAARKKAPPA